MKLEEIIDLLGTDIHHITDDQRNFEITTAAASDLMSDILARINIPDILLTGLTNSQVIRTSSVSGIKAVIIVRGKTLDPQLVDLAKEEGIALLSTHSRLFECCGKLYENGVKSSAS